MNAENEKGFKEFFKFVAFVFFLWLFYCALRAIFILAHNFQGLGKPDYPFILLMFSQVINPFFLFFFIMLLLQRGRWFYALYNKQNVANAFVEFYFQPIIFGGVCFLFIVAPAIDFVFAAFSDHFYGTVTWLIPDMLSLFLLLFFPFVILSFISSRSFRYHHDQKLTGVSLIGVSITAILDFYAYLSGLLNGVFLSVMCKTHLQMVFLFLVGFFILTQLMANPYLDKAYRPRFTAFVFPACVVLLLLVDLFLLAGFRVLCYDPLTEVLP